MTLPRPFRDFHTSPWLRNKNIVRRPNAAVVAVLKCMIEQYQSPLECVCVFLFWGGGGVRMRGALFVLILFREGFVFLVVQYLTLVRVGQLYFQDCRGCVPTMKIFSLICVLINNDDLFTWNKDC